MALGAKLIQSTFRASVTESAANTYTEVTLDLNLGPQGGFIYVLTSLTFQCIADFGGDKDEFEIGLSYDTRTTVGNLGNTQMFWVQAWKMNLLTSGGGIYQPVVHHFLGDGVPIARPQLYVGVEGTSLAAAGKGFVVLRGYYQRATAEEFFRIAQVA